MNERLKPRADYDTFIKGHTVDDGKIVPVSSVAARNLANQRRIEAQRGQPMPHQFGDKKFRPGGFVRPYDRTRTK